MRPAHLSCGTCGKKGHTKLACSRASANNTASPKQPDDFNQITKDLHGMSLNNASVDMYNKQDESVHAMNCQSNLPTPTVSL